MTASTEWTYVWISNGTREGFVNTPPQPITESEVGPMFRGWNGTVYKLPDLVIGTHEIGYLIAWRVS